MPLSHTVVSMRLCICAFVYVCLLLWHSLIVFVFLCVRVCVGDVLTMPVTVFFSGYMYYIECTVRTQITFGCVHLYRNLLEKHAILIAARSSIFWIPLPSQFHNKFTADNGIHVQVYLKWFLARRCLLTRF